MYHVQCIADPTTNKLDPTIDRFESKQEAIDLASFLHFMLMYHYNYVVTDSTTDIVEYNTAIQGRYQV